MKTTKAEIRKIALDLLFKADEPPTQKDQLEDEILDELKRQHGDQPDKPDKEEPSAEGASEYDWQMFNELFWDLILDRIITPGIDAVHPALPNFRLHSEAREKAKQEGGRDERQERATK
jgi:hypothetical protein